MNKIKCPLEYIENGERFCYAWGKCKHPTTKEDCEDLTRYRQTHPERLSSDLVLSLEGAR